MKLSQPLAGRKEKPQRETVSMAQWKVLLSYQEVWQVVIMVSYFNDLKQTNWPNQTASRRHISQTDCRLLRLFGVTQITILAQVLVLNMILLTSHLSLFLSFFWTDLQGTNLPIFFQTILMSWWIGDLWKFWTMELMFIAILP